jgi:Tfp pilus assembly protein PilN
MIIKNNLASSPVKNHTLFFLGCFVLLAATAAFTVFNIRSISTGYLAARKLEADTLTSQKQISDLKQEADALEGRIAVIKTVDFVNETEFVNAAVAKRVFSWTTLFDQLESALPGSVKMVSVSPAFSDKDISIQMEVSGRSLNDIVDLIKRLQASPVFSEVFFMNERKDNDGSLHVSISLRYSPEQAMALRTAAKESALQEEVSAEEEAQ